MPVTRRYIYAKDLAYAKDTTIIVQRGATGATSGVNLRAAYAAAKLLTPGGAARSATNWAVVMIPDGRYDMGATTFTLDGQFIALVGMNPPDPMAVFAGAKPRSYIYNAGGGRCALTQTADYVALHGLTVENAGTTQSTATDGTGFRDSDCGLRIACASTNSRYSCLNFVNPSGCVTETNTNRYGRVAVINDGYDLAGVWSHCYANSAYCWRLQASKNLSATMDHCVGVGQGCFGGDTQSASITGKLTHCVAGAQGFCGCSAAGGSIGTAAVLEDCVAGDSSYAIGNVINGTLRRCKGSLACFAGADNITTGWSGWIASTAVLEDCVATGGASFGGGRSNRAINTPDRYQGVQGTLRRCRCLAMTQPLRLAGGTLIDCEFKCGAADKSAYQLVKAGSKIINCRSVSNGSGNLVTNVIDTGEIYSPYSNWATALQFTGGSAFTRILPPIKAATALTITWYAVAGPTLKTVSIDAADAFTGDCDAGGTNTIDRAAGLISFKQTETGSSAYPIVVNYIAADYPVMIAGGIDNAGGLAATITNVLTASGAVSDAAFTL